ncbi:MAG: carbon-phosphorus lyase complex subunit PhnI [Thermodesulfobacteriota bacterium]
MGYVAVKGGEEAIAQAGKLLAYQRLKGSSAPLEVRQVREQLYLAVDRVMSEGSLYAPELAALALKQAAGDTLEAAFMLRAYRATQPRVGYSLPSRGEDMRIIRRISAAFKDIPGGQVLGPTSDYTLRLLDFDLTEDTSRQRQAFLQALGQDLAGSQPLPLTFPKVIDILRNEGLLAETLESRDQGGKIFDLTRQSLTFPAPRSAALQSMTRGETGGLLLLAYTNMRGYGDIHPTVGELRVGYLPVRLEHPQTGAPYTVGEVKVTEAEVIARFDTAGGSPKFTLGYGLCFGHNEIKAIAMAVLDRAMQTPEPQVPSENQEFVLSHLDGIESLGFGSHWKLPHYVTFQSDLDRLRRAQQAGPESRPEAEKENAD